MSSHKTIGHDVADAAIDVSSSQHLMLHRDSEKYEGLYESTSGDSGFISSTNLTPLSEEIKEIKLAPDSGVIDEEEYDDNQNCDDKENSMRLDTIDSGVDVGISESFSELSLKNGNKLNDLSSSNSLSKTRTNDVPNKVKSQDSIIQEIPAWQLYFGPDEDGDTQLHIAIIQGFIEGVYALLRLAPHPCLLDARNDHCHTPLHLAVLTRQPQLARILVAAGAKNAIPDGYGDTPLHLACRNGDVAAVKAIATPISVAETEALGLSYTNVVHDQIDFQQTNYQGQMCVHLAVKNSHVDVLRHLVWLGADINAREGLANMTALHLASLEANLPMLQFLLTECPSVQLEATGYGQRTAYQLACSLQVCEMLAERGVNTEFDDDSGEESETDSEDEICYQSQNNHFTPNLAINTTS